MKFSGDIFRHRSGKLLWFGIGACALFLSILSFLKYHYFLYGDWDLATYNQIMRGFLQGHPYTTLGDISFFGNHAEGTLILFVPFYALCPHPVTLLVLQSAVLALAAFPLFLIARTVFGELESFLVCVLYFFYPSLGFINFNEFHPECLLPLIQFFLFYYFYRRDFKKFFIFMLLCLFAKENMPFIVIMFGILAAIQRRPGKWIIVPLVAGASWFFIYMKIIFPRLSEGSIGFNYIYSHMGNSLPAVALFMATHPLKIFLWLLQPRPLAYLYQLILPLGFMPLLSPGTLMLALPNLLQHLLSRRMTETNINFYYPAEFLAFIFIAAIYGLRRLLNLLSLERRRLFLLFLFVVVFCSISLSPQVSSMVGLARGKFVDKARRQTYRTLIRALPRDANTVATFSFLPELSRRSSRLDSFHKVLTGENYPGWSYALPKECSAALIDFGDVKTFNDFFFKEEYHDNLKKFFSGGVWSAQMALENAVLFKKSAKGIVFLSKSREVSGANEPLFIFDGTLAILKCEREPFMVEGQKAVRLTLSWSLLKRTDITFWLRVALVNGLGKVVYSVRHPMGYNIYPTNECAEGETVREVFQFLLPRDAGPGPYQVCLAVVNRNTGTFSFVTGGREGASGGIKVCFSL